MIIMRIEINIAEHMDTLLARQEIAARVYSRLATVEWIKKVKVIHEQGT